MKKHETKQDPVDIAIQTIKKLRKGIKLGKKLNIRKMRNETRH